MKIWLASREELELDMHYLRQAFRDGVQPAEGNARIVFHDTTQESVRVITPAPNFVGMLMAGGYVRRVRCIGTDSPILEGEPEGRMPAMTYDEAIAFIAWKDLPSGVNNFEVMTTDDLPRVHGCIDKARKFRDAWKLEEVQS